MEAESPRKKNDGLGRCGSTSQRAAKRLRPLAAPGRCGLMAGPVGPRSRTGHRSNGAGGGQKLKIPSLCWCVFGNNFEHTQSKREGRMGGAKVHEWPITTQVKGAKAGGLGGRVDDGKEDFGNRQ